MIIACDIDNVICNLQETVTELFNERYGTNYMLEDFHDYNIENILSIQETSLMKEMYGESGIYDLVKPIAKSQNGLKKLIKEGHQVYLVTDAIPKIYDEKLEWVHHFFPFIDDSHIVAMKHKHLFKCDIMIEDNMQNLISGVHYDRICFDYPWNRNVHDHIYDIYRCNDWDEIVDIVNKLNIEE